MWLRWILVAAAFAIALIILGIFITGDSECRNWQKGYTVVYEEHVQRTGPLILREVEEDTNERLGPRPEGCDIPQRIND